MIRCYGRDERCTCTCYGCPPRGQRHCTRIRWTLRERIAAWWYSLDL